MANLINHNVLTLQIEKKEICSTLNSCNQNEKKPALFGPELRTKTIVTTFTPSNFWKSCYGIENQLSCYLRSAASHARTHAQTVEHGLSEIMKRQVDPVNQIHAKFDNYEATDTLYSKFNIT